MEVIIKPTGSCNGTCVYCSAAGGQEQGRTFPRERLGAFFEAFQTWLEHNPRQGLRFIWHGGEPLLCGRAFFEAVVREEHRVFGAECHRVRNTVQSNLTLLTPEWIPCLKDLVGDEIIGTSFDIVPGVRGLKTGDDLGRVWVRAVQLLRAHQFNIGVVYVVHRASLGRVRDLYYFFTNLDPMLGLRFNPLYREGRGMDDECRALWVTPEQYGQFLIELCEVWLEEDQRGHVTPLREWKRIWEGGSNLSCDSNGRCHETHLGIEADGRVFNCGREADGGHRPLGNIFTDPLDTILAHPTKQVLARRGAALREGECRGCPYWPACHGGCPSEAWLYHEDVSERTYFCPARKMVFAHFQERFGPPMFAPEAAYA